MGNACPFKNDGCDSSCKFYDPKIDCKCLILYACTFAKIKFDRLMEELAKTGTNDSEQEISPKLAKEQKKMEN